MKTKPFLQMDPTGVFVEGYGNAKRMPEGAIEVPAGLRAADFKAHYILDGKLQARPKAPTPKQLSPGVYRLEACPIGATVVVVDVSGREMLASVEIAKGEQDFDFGLPDAGVYRVEVEPPLPYMPSKAILEV